MGFIISSSFLPIIALVGAGPWVEYARATAAPPAEQEALLQSILRGHILAFATGIGWRVEDRIQVEITRMKEIKPLTFKGKKLPSGFTYPINNTPTV